MNNPRMPLPEAKRSDLLPRGHWACLLFFLVSGALLPDLIQVNLEPLAYSAAECFRTARRTLLGLTTDQSHMWLFYPSALVLGIATILRLAFQHPPNVFRLPIALMFAALQAAYLVFRLVATLSLASWPDATVSIMFFVSEVFIHFRIALGNLSLLKLTDRTAHAEDSQRVVRNGSFRPRVDIFVPTYSEPIEMLRRTIIGCQAIDYPFKTVCLLDDQRRSIMRALAEELGCEYFDRPDNRHAKAGNLNHALPLTEGDLIVCFDADFVPCRDFLERTVGFFRDPAVAMVQTPQNFFNEDAVTRNLGLDHVLEDEQRLFFRTLQPGRDAVNAVVCHGSCFVVRRSALEEIGGVPTETITEDWATSIKLQAAGYEIVYLNEPLSAGICADKCGEFVQQRARWAQGTLQALFASTNPLTVRGLNWKQRLTHFSSIVYYLGSLSTLFNLIAPLLFLFFGTHLLQMTLAEMVFYRAPFAIGFLLLYSWLSCGNRSAIWTELYETFLAPSIGLTVLRSLVKPFGAGFRVTDKVIRQGHLALNRRVALPFVGLLALHVVGIVFAILVHRHIEEREAFGIAMYFALCNIAILWLCVLVSIDIAQRHSFVRFAKRLPGVLTSNGTKVSAETIALSEGDVVVRTTECISGFGPDTFLHLLGLDLRVEVKEVNEEGQITFAFADLTLPQRRRLIENLFCESRRWDRPPRSELRATWEYLRAGLRMFPLAESK